MNQTRDYYEGATGWALDARALSARSRRTAWIVAGVAVAVALFEAVALAMLAPLKSVETVTLLVDKQTGYVQAIDPLTPRRLLADDSLTDSYLAQYVTARESFDRVTVANDYRKVALWSAGPARSGYLAIMPASNAASPFQRVPAGSTVQASVKSVSRLDKGLALVRFDTAVVDRTGQRSPVQPWVAVLRFRFLDAPMCLEDRLINPLGFQVTSYRRDAEAIQTPAVSSTSVVPAAAVVPASGAVATVRLPATTTVVETSRSVVRTEPASSIRPRSMPVPASPLRYRQRREVPLNRLPLGSPLSSSNAVQAAPGGTVR